MSVNETKQAFDNASEAAQRFNEAALDALIKPAMVKPDPSKLEFLPREGEAAPEYGWGRWCKRGDGRYVFVPLAGRWIQVTPEFAAGLGFTSSFQQTMRMFRNLARAGMIEMVAVSPKVSLVELGSLREHLKKGAADVDRFDRGTTARHDYQFGNGK